MTRRTEIPRRAKDRPDWLGRRIRAEALRRLGRLEGGRVAIVDGDGEHLVREGDPGDPVRIRVADARFYRALALGGSLGAAESWARGDWTCDDLPALFRLFARNIASGGAGTWFRPGITERLERVRHALRRNTESGSRRNIRDHYDLGNDFFALFLDETMTYSCGIFRTPDSSLREASAEKLDTVCRKLELGPGDRVLEIGSGWGSFAIHAAGRYGCRVRTITVSRAQRELAVERVRQAGLSDRVEVLLRDYRKLDGIYDKLVSIEMIEAVGHRNLETYFDACDRLLRPGGAMLLQAIVLDDRDHAEYLRSVDFIQKYIFPGSCLPSEGSLRAALETTSLRVEHVDDIGLHYVPTLRAWCRRFLERVDRVRALGYPERLIRLWEYYFRYCEAGFAERYLGDLQILLRKPPAAARRVRTADAEAA